MTTVQDLKDEYNISAEILNRFIKTCGIRLTTYGNGIVSNQVEFRLYNEAPPQLIKLFEERYEDINAFKLDYYSERLPAVIAKTINRLEAEVLSVLNVKPLLRDFLVNNKNNSQFDGVITSEDKIKFISSIKVLKHIQENETRMALRNLS